MKKTYINPAMTIVKIQTTQMLADSTVTMRGNYDDETITIAGRQSDADWDDEEY